MAPRPLDPGLSAEVDTERRWSVYRCEHGCFHVALDRFTVTLTDDEFQALQILMNQAWVRFHGRAMPTPAVRRPH